MKFHLAALAFVSCGLAPAASAQQGPQPPATATGFSISLAPWTVTLVDLDSSDGIPVSITYFGYRAYDYLRLQSLDGGNAFKSEDVTTSTTNSVSIPNGTITAGAAITQSQGLSVYGGFGAKAPLGTMQISAFDVQLFTLSPHTKATFSDTGFGSMSFAHSSDYGSGEIFFGIDTPGGATSYDYGYTYFGSDYKTSSAFQTFTSSIQSGDTPLTAQISRSADATMVLSVSAVPEPATYATLLAGLVGLSGLASRRRERGQQRAG